MEKRISYDSTLVLRTPLDVIPLAAYIALGLLSDIAYFALSPKASDSCMFMAHRIVKHMRPQSKEVI